MNLEEENRQVHFERPGRWILISKDIRNCLTVIELFVDEIRSKE